MVRSTLFSLLIALLFVSNASGQTDLHKKAESGLRFHYQLIDGQNERFTLSERMDYYNVPGLSFAVVKNGKLEWANGYGIADSEKGSKVTPQTLFQAGSISKPIAALGVLKLVAQGKLDMDTTVTIYLDSSWQLPESKYLKKENVTIRRLLSHTAGVNVHGFLGYSHDLQVPSLIDVLNGEGNSPAIEVTMKPGKQWKYSGGGYQILQKVVENVSGMAFDQFMKNEVLVPLGMKNSTYTQPIPEDLRSDCSAAYNEKGEYVEGGWNTYPEQAAAGLWTTPSDLARYYLEMQAIMNGKQDGLIPKQLVEEMITPIQNNWGLGVMLENRGDSLVFGHGGKNIGFTNNMKGFANHGDALIVMTNGDRGFRLINEVMRSLSDTYLLYLMEVDPVKTNKTVVPDDVLDQYVGSYKFKGKNPYGNGDYVIKVSRVNQRFMVNDPQDDKRYTMTALSNSWFINLEEGHQLRFDSKKVVLNGRLKFKKLKQ
ncbi:MAG: beta-lactamase family protein [Bacteroidia bacterium]|nr:beta-lactamase family protein [Bacteroidia bacterium]